LSCLSTVAGFGPNGDFGIHTKDISWQSADYGMAAAEEAARPICDPVAGFGIAYDAE
jgi:hypothetical protein